MNILFLNTSEEYGGAAIAAKRLVKALQKSQIDATLLVRDRSTTDSSVIALPSSRKLAFNFLKERFVIWRTNRFSRKNLFAISIANTGSDITKLPEFAHADVIHIHWVNQGFISLKVLKKIIDSGKPIVWTMHDMWPVTGICHHSRSCDKYMSVCKNCAFLVKNKEKDLSYNIFLKKKKMYRTADITFVGCSLWLTELARQSKLTQGKEVISIPNPLDVDFYKPQKKSEARERLGLPQNMKLILFGAAKTTDKRKGIDYFIDSCKLLNKEIPDNVGIVLYGKDSDKLTEMFNYPTFSLGYVKDHQKLIDIYSAVDIFAIPSLEDNLPNTIIESMACGTPAIGFNIGGIPEIIDHLHNGYVANYKSAKDFSKGLKWIIEHNSDGELGVEARRKVVASYSEKEIAQQYIALYNQIIK